MILLRHGQSEFNLHFGRTRVDPGIEDPRLTELGHQQAAEAAEAMAGEDIRRIVVSPYTRALQTALPVAKRLGLPLTITPTVRERYAFACDVGRPIGALRLEFPDLEFRDIDEVWWPAQEETAEGIIARAALFRAEISALQDWPHTLVVTHWGFILAMTNKSVMNGQWVRCDPTEPPPPEVVWKHH